MSAEQRVVSFVVMVSWLIWGVVMACSWTNASTRAQVYSQQMVPSFLDFLSQFPLETVAKIPFQSSSRNEHDANNSHVGLRVAQRDAEQSIRSYDLNEVDSLFLEALPRIGPNLAGRICRFRDLLGGFYSVEQLDEVWGIYPDQLQAIRPWFHIGDGVYQKLCADSASWDDLRRHPYIGFQGARKIERYRLQHPLNAVSDLLDAVPISDSLYRCWEPYLRLCITSQ
ncbi:MAG: helix-hairpin-helix domain-containing protein [Flavobacteriales bacterium]|nr:helix-hairpin-helix domain-containing protein [Flavobacteriales bacterium]